MTPGNFTLPRFLAVNNFIYFNFAIPSTNFLDFSRLSLSISKDLIMLWVVFVCIRSSFRTSSIADRLVFRETPLDSPLKFVLIKLFLVRHESFIVLATILKYICTFIKLLVASFSFGYSCLYKHWFSPKMRMFVCYVWPTVLWIHIFKQIIKLLLDLLITNM